MVCCTENFENSQLQDLLYRTNKLTDSSGSVHESYDCDAYGRTLMFDSSDTAITAPTCEFVFTGRRYDPETSLYFYRARYYSPELGRFISKDPLGYVDGMGLYEYVSSMSSTIVDPFGLVTIYADDSKVCKELKSKYNELALQRAYAIRDLTFAKQFLNNYNEMYGKEIEQLQQRYKDTASEANQYYILERIAELRSIGADIASSRSMIELAKAGIPGPDGPAVDGVEETAKFMDFAKIAELAKIIGTILTLKTLYTIYMSTFTGGMATSAMEREKRYAQHYRDLWNEKIEEQNSIKDKLDKLQDERNKRLQEVNKYQKLVNDLKNKLSENAKQRAKCKCE